MNSRHGALVFGLLHGVAVVLFVPAGDQVIEIFPGCPLFSKGERGGFTI
jgi:hypothetical protein